MTSDNGTCQLLYNYDVANRLTGSGPAHGSDVYMYNAQNQRVAVIRIGDSQETLFLYGQGGEKLATIKPNQISAINENVYFAGQLWQKGLNQRVGSTLVLTDRLGSVRGSYFTYPSSGQSTFPSYLPFGEEQGSGSSNDSEKFATYTRDSATGFDYADQRYYTSNFGRFMTADPYRQTAKAIDSGSWNKYSYTRGDPINRVDPSGTCDEDTNTTVTVCADTDPVEPQLPGPRKKITPQQPAGDPPVILKVANLTKSGSRFEAVKARFENLESNIDEQCEKFLNSGGSGLDGSGVKSYIKDLLTYNLLAVATYRSDIAAFTGTSGSNIPAGNAAITVNTASAFFNGNFTVDNGQLKGGTAQAQAFILLQELGHALSTSSFQSDFGNKAAGKSNDDLIDQNCQATLNSFK